VTAEQISLAVWRAIGLTTVVLIGVTYFLLLIRSSSSGLGVRVATSLGLLLAFVFSPVLVNAMSEPALQRGYGAGIYFDPSPLMMVVPAVLALLVGAALWFTTLKRSPPGRAA
jgi:hypothetical protein